MSELVVLDLDGVIVRGQSQQIFLNYLFKKEFVGLFFYLKIYFWFLLYKTGFTKNPKNIMEYAFSFLKNKEAGELEKIAEDFFEKVLHKYIFTEIIDIINEHKAKNRELLIVSNSADIIVKKIANFLGIKNYIGTRLEIVNGKFTGNILGDIVYGKNKISFVREFIKKNKLDLDSSYGYTDHISDLNLLEMVSNPCAVNPDKNLLGEAKKRNWPILIFKNK